MDNISWKRLLNGDYPDKKSVIQLFDKIIWDEKYAEQIPLEHIKENHFNASDEELLHRLINSPPTYDNSTPYGTFNCDEYDIISFVSNGLVEKVSDIIYWLTSDQTRHEACTEVSVDLREPTGTIIGVANGELKKYESSSVKIAIRRDVPMREDADNPTPDNQLFFKILSAYPSEKYMKEIDAPDLNLKFVDELRKCSGALKVAWGLYLQGLPVEIVRSGSSIKQVNAVIPIAGKDVLKEHISVYVSLKGKPQIEYVNCVNGKEYRQAAELFSSNDKNNSGKTTLTPEMTKRILQLKQFFNNVHNNYDDIINKNVLKINQMIPVDMDEIHEDCGTFIKTGTKHEPEKTEIDIDI